MPRLLLVIVLVLSAVPLDAQVRLRFVPVVTTPGSAPGAPTALSPTTGATGIGISPSLSFSCAGATSYAIDFGTDNPPTNIALNLSLGGTPLYSPAVLVYSQTYRWKVYCTNAFGTTPGDVWTFTTRPEPTSTLVDHPRLFLTTTKLAELVARKDANTTEYSDFKTWVDSQIPSDNSNTTLTSSITADQGAGSTFTVADGSGFPTASAAAGTITAFSDYSGTVAGTVLAFNTSHGLTTGNTITIQGTHNDDPELTKDEYNGDHVITVVNANQFYFTATYGGRTFDAPWDAARKIRINYEALRIIRTANTFTVVDRAYDLYGRHGVTTPKAHATGATVWENNNVGDVSNGAYGVALLRKLGVAGYDDKSRNAMNLLLYLFSNVNIYNSNEARHMGHFVGMVYDWNYDQLTADDKAAYATMFHDILTFYTVTNPIFNPDGTSSLALRETVITGNVPSGIVRAIIAMSAAIMGDDPDAADHWAVGQTWAGFLRSALLTGAASGGVNAEGSEYSQTDWSIYPDVFGMIASATNTPTELSDMTPFEAQLVKLLANLSLPGSSNSAVSTNCSIDVGSTTLTCADASTFTIGENIAVNLEVGSGNLTINSPRTNVTPSGHTVTAADVGKSIWINVTTTLFGPVGQYWKFWIVGQDGTNWTLEKAIPSTIDVYTLSNPQPWSFGARGYAQNSNLWPTTVVDKSGNVITTRDPAPGNSVSRAITHLPSLRPFGDVESTMNYDDFAYTGGEVGLALAHAQDILLDNGQTPIAEYAEYLIDNLIPSSVGSAPYQKPLWFMWREPSITATNPSALGLNFVTPDPDAFGVLVANSDWTATRTQVSFITGSAAGNHNQSSYGSYGIRRKGVYLTRDLVGYDLAPDSVANYYNEFSGSGYSEVAWLGARFKNSVQMNGHSGHHNRLSAPPLIGGVTTPRFKAATNYAYMRMDASNAYRGDTGGVNWVALGYPNNDALTWVRDFFVLNPDVVFVFDRNTYANATTSPTRYNFQFPCDPSTSSQRITCTYAGQKLVQDIKLPTSATITERNYRTDLDGAFDGFRIEVQSGVSASTEYHVSVIQVMDSGDSPVAVTTLTTTNANVVEVAVNTTCPNGCVVGDVKGTTPTLNITYTYSATDPDHYMLGFVPSTAYHVDNNAGTKTVTISPATESGDLTATAEGVLVF